jgi:hypothetical protein
VSNVFGTDGVLGDAPVKRRAQRRITMPLQEVVKLLDIRNPRCGRRCVSSVRYASAAGPRSIKCWRCR